MGINASIKYFKTDDGLDLYYQHWIPESPKALLIFVHDFGDHISRHGAFIRHFLKRDYAVALYDQRGHGKSGGRKGDAKQFNDFICDLSNFIHFSRAASPPATPIFLAGAGVGSQFIINLLVPAWHAVSWGGVHPGKIDGFITISAAIEPIIKTSKWKHGLFERIVRFLPKFRVGTQINPYDIVSNADKAEAFGNDPLVGRKISLRLQKQMLDNAQLIMAMASRIQIPALMLHGKGDRIASPEGTKQFFLRLPSPTKRLHMYDDCLHDLTNETTRDQIFNDIENWLKETHHSSKGAVCDLLPIPL